MTAAYAASILVFALLNVDPMAAARGAANDLTAAGERALTDARVAAVKRVEDSAIARYAAPLTKRLDYRVYRAFVAGRARATAYPSSSSRGSSAAPSRPCSPRPRPRRNLLHASDVPEGKVRTMSDTNQTPQAPPAAFPASAPPPPPPVAFGPAAPAQPTYPPGGRRAPARQASSGSSRASAISTSASCQRGAVFSASGYC